MPTHERFSDSDSNSSDSDVNNDDVKKGDEEDDPAGVNFNLPQNRWSNYFSNKSNGVFINNLQENVKGTKFKNKWGWAVPSSDKLKLNLRLSLV